MEASDTIRAFYGFSFLQLNYKFSVIINDVATALDLWIFNLKKLSEILKCSAIYVEGLYVMNNEIYWKIMDQLFGKAH